MVAAPGPQQLPQLRFVGETRCPINDVAGRLATLAGRRLPAGRLDFDFQRRDGMYGGSTAGRMRRMATRAST